MVIGGRYQLGEALGAGGMGRVYAAEDLATGLTVAIKVMFRDRPLADVPHIDHPNVVRVLDRGRTDAGAPFIVMERLRGTPLGTAIRHDGALPLARVLRIGTQLLAGLGALHERELVHADVKSDNLMVEAQANDRTKLIDLTAMAMRRTTAQSFCGTPDYVAPEVICGDPPTAASDLYAVGVILYEMLTGTTPFGGGSPREIFERHVRELPVAISVRFPDREVPAELEHLVARVLEKDPHARPRDAAAITRDLELALPATYEHERVPVTGVFSTVGDTRDWVEPAFEPTATWRHRAR